MKDAYIANEIATALNVTRSAVVHRSKREGWQKAKRGRQRPFLASSLPEDVRIAIAEHQLAESVPAVRQGGDPAPIREEPERNPALFKDWQREVRDARLAVLEMVRSMAEAYGGVTKAEAALAGASAERHPEDRLSEQLIQTLRKANARRGNSCHVGASTLRLWRRTREKHGPDALAPRAAERTEPDHPDWLREFVKYYCRPTQPSISQVYEYMRKQQRMPSLRTVQRQVKSLPPLAANKGRMGPREIKCIKAYVKRTTDELLPGDVYTADGHKADIEVQHPEHGQAVRPEIISVLDVKTRRCVGFSAELHERAWLVADALRVACQWNGIPAIWYVDNGCGFKNELFSGPGVGILHRLGVTIKHSIPYNSQARGIIEKFNDTCWVRSARNVPTYIGWDMDRDAKDRVFKATRKDLAECGTSKWLMDWETFLAWATEQVMDYNDRPHTSLPKIRDPRTGAKRHMSPNECWDSLADRAEIIKPTQLEVDDLFRPYVVRACRRCLVRVYNGEYYAPELQDYHGQDVRVGIDIFNPEWVWVRDMNGRLITTAELNAHARPYFHPSVVEQAREKRAQGQLDRLDEKRARVLEAAQKKIENGGEPAPEPDELPESAREAQRELERAMSAPGPQQPETELQRFKKAKQLERRMESGEAVPGEDAKWLRGYQRTSEYRGYQDMYEDFGEAVFG